MSRFRPRPAPAAVAMASRAAHAALRAASHARRRQAWRWLLPLSLLTLCLAALLWLPWQAQQLESRERQEQLEADTRWVEQTIRYDLAHNEENLDLVAGEIVSGYLPQYRARERFVAILRNSRELTRLAWYDRHGEIIAASYDGASDGQVLAPMELRSPQSKQAMQRARDSGRPLYSQPARQAGGPQATLLEYHIPLFEP
ncbi:MAG: PAS domain-containing sensor histidine kinase, partial [Janthinobacterium lividum]